MVVYSWHSQFIKDAFGWGFILWLIGYALGTMLFAIVPVSIINIGLLKSRRVGFAAGKCFY